MESITQESVAVTAKPVTALIFSTPTTLDLRELFVLGLGSKRGDATKIGHKGSGMKFTLALLHRLGSALEVRIDGITYRSAINTVVIRGTEHQLITLIADTGAVVETNISLNAGADTWREPWFALRELVQNCIDEGGTTSLVEGLSDGQMIQFGGTVIRVVLTSELAEAWSNHRAWHHERNGHILYLNDHPGLYYHGFRIYSPPGKPWRYAYDVTTLIERDNLSEDRQLRNVDIGKLFRDIIGACPSLPAELYTMFLDNVGQPPDVGFMLSAAYNLCCRTHPDAGGFKLSLLEDALLAKHGEHCCIAVDPNEATKYHAAALGMKIVYVNYHTYALFSYSSNDRIKFADNLVPALEKRLVTVRPSDIGMDNLTKLKSALRITKRLRPDGCEVQIVTALAHDAKEIKAVAFAVMADNKVLILESHVKRATMTELVNTLIEEFMHLRSRAGDCTREYQAALIAAMTELLTPRQRSGNSL